MAHSAGFSLRDVRQDDTCDESGDGDDHCGGGCYKFLLFHNSSIVLNYELREFHSFVMSHCVNFIRVIRS